MNDKNRSKESAASPAAVERELISAFPSPEQKTPSAHSIPTLITKKEIALRYGVTTGCITNWMNQRRIPFYKFSAKLVRFDPVACDEALKKFEVRARKNN